MTNIEEIKTIVNALKANGHGSLTTRDIGLYLMKRVDDMDHKLDQKVDKTECAEVRKSFVQNKQQTVTWIISIIAIVISAGIGVLVLLR